MSGSTSPQPDTGGFSLLHTAMQHLGQGISVFDHDLKLAFANQRLAEMLDLPPHLLLPGTDFAEIVHFTTARGDYGLRDADSVLAERLQAGGRIKLSRTGGTVLEATDTPLPGGGLVCAYTDVTHHLDVERELRAEKELLETHVAERTSDLQSKSVLMEAILQNIGQGLVAVDRDLNIVLTNRRFLDLLGLPPELGQAGAPLAAVMHEMVNRGDFGPGDAEQLVAARLARIVSISGPQVFERERPDGTTTEIRFNPMPDGGVVFTYTDVTERRLREQALRTTEQRLHAILRHSAAVIYLKDTAGRYLLASRQFERIVGQDNERIIGKSNFDLFETDVAERMNASDKRAVESGRRIDIEEVIPGARGVRTYATVKVPIMNAYAMPEGLCVISTDITERKRTEERLRQALAEQSAVFDSASFGIAIVRQERFQQVNRTLEDMFGYARADLINSPSAICYPSEDDYLETCAESDSILGSGGTYRTERLMRRKDDSRFWGYLVASPIDPSDPAHGIIWLIEDMTERKKAQDALIAAIDSSENANRAKSQFLANMSHELRTPLNAIIGFSDFIRSQIFGPLGKEQYLTYAEDIHKSGLHLLSVINDILDLSKIESGRYELVEEEMDVAMALANCQSMVRVRMDERNVTLKTVIADSLPLLWADRTCVTQVILNLLSNAAKFTDPGGSVTVAVFVDEPGQLTVSVTDTGIGIPEHAISAIFEPFQQASANISRTHGGTGLGLPISLRLMEMHGGTISISSVLGQGTTATAAFPRERVRPRTGD